MNRVQPALASGAAVFQTWNPIIAPVPERVHAQARFDRPVVNAAALIGAREMDLLHAQHGRRLWFCGSYRGPGIPLLESAAATAARVAEAIDHPPEAR
jgi:uncharacterized protein